MYHNFGNIIFRNGAADYGCISNLFSIWFREVKICLTNEPRELPCNIIKRRFVGWFIFYLKSPCFSKFLFIAYINFIVCLKLFQTLGIEDPNPDQLRWKMWRKISILPKNRSEEKSAYNDFGFTICVIRRRK